MPLTARLAVALIVGLTGPLAMLWPILPGWRDLDTVAGLALASAATAALTASVFGRRGAFGAGLAAGGAVLTTLIAAALFGALLLPLQGAVLGPALVLLRLDVDPGVALVIVTGFAAAHLLALRLRRA